MKKFVIIGLALILVLATGGTKAAETDISGTLKSDLIWDTETEELTDEETLNLVLERSFGFDADMKVDLQVNSYRTDQVVVPTEEGLTTEGLPQLTRETDVSFNEAYVNYYTSNMDWRLGKQKINWGSGYKLQPTDYFNPQDLTVLHPLDEKVGVKAVQGTYYLPNNIEVTGVVTPFFDSHKLRDVEQVERREELETQTLQQTAENIYGFLAEKDLINDSLNTELTVEDVNDVLVSDQTIEKVEDEIENAQGGAKFTKRRLGSFDLSLSAYHGRDKSPVVDKEKLAAEVKELVSEYAENGAKNYENFDEYYKEQDIGINLLYPEANRVGFDLIGDLDNIGIWTEMTYSIYDDDQFDDRLEATVGADRRFSNDLYLVGQYYHREGRIEAEDDTKLANIYFDKPVSDFHEVEMTIIYEFEAETYLVNPQFNYSLANSTVLEIGGTYLENSGESTGIISFSPEDKIYTSLRVDF